MPICKQTTDSETTPGVSLLQQPLPRATTSELGHGKYKVAVPMIGRIGTGRDERMSQPSASTEHDRRVAPGPARSDRASRVSLAIDGFGSAISECSRTFGSLAGIALAMFLFGLCSWRGRWR